MYEILLKQQGQQDQVGKLAPGSYTIGSGDRCQIRFEAAGMSSAHCQLVVSESSLKVADLNSSNGTYVDGNAIGQQPVEVMIGSTIAIATIQIMAKGPESHQVQAPVVPQAPAVQEQPATPQNNFPMNDYEGSKIPVLRISGVPDAARPFV